VLSFHSKRFYRDVSCRWKGTNIGYLCVLLAICLIPEAYNSGRKAETILDEKSDVFLMQIPPMQFKDGRLVVDAPQPYSIIEGNNTVLLIDTTGEIDNLQDVGAFALLTQSQLHLKQTGKPPLVYELDEFGDLEMSEAIAAAIVTRTKKLFIPVFYGLTYVFSLILFVLASLLLAAIAQLFGILLGRDVNYGAGIRLSIVALTPPALIGAALAVANLRMPFVLYALLALTYLYIAVGCARKKQPNDLYLDDEAVGH